MWLANFQFGVMTLLNLVEIALVLWALIDAATRPAPAFEVTDRLTKTAWLVILGLSLGVTLFLGGFLTFVAVVATLVYLLDVRPALASVTRR